MAEDQRKSGIIDRLKRLREESKAAEVRGNEIVSQIEARIAANAQGVLPSVSQEAVDETLKAFWNTDESISASSDVVHGVVERVMERLRIVNPGLAKIIDEFDNEPPDYNSASYLTTMILAALTHNSTPRTE